ncbi:MAG: biopolymer transporter ExbD [Bacteroidales bacterium]|jgi:biopolymer transport protein ExbD|nr:biopolymer transporter ExbD [Bacteroidales bacterium]
MARFKKSNSGELPAINTGSMADIVFILLFFFMVITTMRESTLFVKILPPRATEVHKLERKSLVSNIYIGQPTDVAALGTDSRIQLNDQLAEVADIPSFILAEREARDEVDVPLLTTSLKVDKDTRMRIVTAVKQELRQVGAFKINYSTSKGKTAL